MAVRMVFHGTLCQRLPLASVGSPLQVSDDVQSVGRSSVCLTGAIKNTRRHAGSVRSPSVLLRRSKGVQQLSWLKSEFNGPLPVRGLQSKANVRGFSRNSETIASSSGAVNESSSPESSHASGGDDGDRKFAWLETLGKTALPVAILAVGILLRTRPSLALASNALQEAAVGPARKQLLASAWTGLAAGCLHTLTGPDHLAALAPLSIGRSKLESAAVGALWGCGHDAGQVLFGIVFLLLKDKLHLDLIRTWASRVVGLTLITIGGIGIMESQEMHVALVDGGGDDNIAQSETRVKPRRNVATFATGVVHGLQPDALLMVLPALALPSRVLGAAYLGMFLVGTVIAMGSYTFFIASCSQALQKKVPGITKNLTFGSSCIAILLGSVFILGEFLGMSLFGG
ncbi:hypothetical protein MPTK1_3g18390 [Marchantia polymorpha subsp. ruderalis]|uniref:Urease accessory protein UreH-like transmembrane domain-containing protein n=2 Tax=Marchantia polymorpha TaxID=3197 RepID=A0AAF6B268_MARPO|nr:hypothetical protein MARPO_0140s0003 [Marchantia polymorpha]BBN06102.1 hypothetical protein Mp_3g18390 [Marchantia polymorpha subsp. ruderalis]|eukprot:PTQ29466.1 hypothetical protein MARPO_0140s0003 [Marchantia polymorpha]